MRTLTVPQVGGLLYHLYNQASYMVLDLPGTTPVTLSVVRCLGEPARLTFTTCMHALHFTL